MYHAKVIDARGRGKGKERDKMLGIDGDLDRSFLVQGHQPPDHHTSPVSPSRAELFATS